jgi:hypothetical protein
VTAPSTAYKRGYRDYTLRRVTGYAYRRGFRENQILWRGLWYGLLLWRGLRWLKPAPVLIAREVLGPGETVSIRQTTEKVGKRRK